MNHGYKVHRPYTSDLNITSLANVQSFLDVVKYIKINLIGGSTNATYVLKGGCPFNFFYVLLYSITPTLTIQISFNEAETTSKLRKSPSCHSNP